MKTKQQLCAAMLLTAVTYAETKTGIIAGNRISLQKTGRISHHPVIECPVKLLG